ncbi:MAG: hypothetical protein ABIK25_07255 [Pseudomonadota bacterium]
MSRRVQVQVKGALEQMLSGLPRGTESAFIRGVLLEWFQANGEQAGMSMAAWEAVTVGSGVEPAGVVTRAPRKQEKSRARQEKAKTKPSPSLPAFATSAPSPLKQEAAQQAVAPSIAAQASHTPVAPVERAFEVTPEDLELLADLENMI